jgi:Triose-phosphate Transporter family
MITIDTPLVQVISLGAGAVSFTHIVKAAEPIFSTIMSALVLKSTFPWQVRPTTRKLGVRQCVLCTSAQQCCL